MLGFSEQGNLSLSVLWSLLTSLASVQMFIPASVAASSQWSPQSGHSSEVHRLLLTCNDRSESEGWEAVGREVQSRWPSLSRAVGRPESCMASRCSAPLLVPGGGRCSLDMQQGHTASARGSGHSALVRESRCRAPPLAGSAGGLLLTGRAWCDRDTVPAACRSPPGPAGTPAHMPLTGTCVSF